MIASPRSGPSSRRQPVGDVRPAAYSCRAPARIAALTDDLRCIGSSPLSGGERRAVHRRGLFVLENLNRRMLVTMTRTMPSLGAHFTFPRVDRIPTFNRPDLTRQCLIALHETAPEAEVIVVRQRPRTGREHRRSSRPSTKPPHPRDPERREPLLRPRLQPGRAGRDAASTSSS